MTPIEIVASALEEAGIDVEAPVAAKIFLLGYVIGREWPLDEPAIRRVVASLYAPEGCRSTSTSATRTSAVASPG